MKGVKVIARSAIGETAMREVMREGDQNKAVAEKFFLERVLSEKPLVIALTYKRAAYALVFNRKQLSDVVVRGMGAKNCVQGVDFEVTWI